MKEQPECECGKSASFFHSKCCNAHFEGVIYENGKYAIVCEECQKFCAFIDQLPPVQPGRSRDGPDYETMWKDLKDEMVRTESWQMYEHLKQLEAKHSPKEPKEEKTDGKR